MQIVLLQLLTRRAKTKMTVFFQDICSSYKLIGCRKGMLVGGPEGLGYLGALRYFPLLFKNCGQQDFERVGIVFAKIPVFVCKMFIS